MCSGHIGKYRVQNNKKRETVSAIQDGNTRHLELRKLKPRRIYFIVTHGHAQLVNEIILYMILFGFFFEMHVILSNAPFKKVT